MSKHPRRICRCLPGFDALEERNLLSHFATPTSRGSFRADFREIGPSGREYATFDRSPGRYEGRHDSRSGHRPSEGAGWSPGDDGFGPLSARSTFTSPSGRYSRAVENPAVTADIPPIRTASVAITIQATPPASARDVRAAASSGSSGSEARATDSTSAETAATSSSEGVVLIVAPSSSATATVQAPPGPGDGRSSAPTPAVVPGSARSVNDAAAPRPSGSPLGPPRANPAAAIPPAPEAGPPILVPAPVDAGPQEGDRGRPSADLPEPRGAGLITEMAPLGAGAIEESLAWLLDGFGGLGEPSKERVRTPPYLFAVVLAVAAFEAARRWRRRRTSAGRLPSRCPRGFMPDGLA